MSLSVVDNLKLLYHSPQVRFSVQWWKSGSENNVFCLETHPGDLQLLLLPFKSISGSAEPRSLTTGFSTSFLTKTKKKSPDHWGHSGVESLKCSWVTMGQLKGFSVYDEQCQYCNKSERAISYILHVISKMVTYSTAPM